MATRSRIRRLFARKPRTVRKAPAPFRPAVQALEDRIVLNSYTAATAADLIKDIGLANQAGGTNTITLSAPTSSPYTLNAVDNSTDGPTGLQVIHGGSTLIIIGGGDTIQRSTASGTPAFRLFDVAPGATLNLQNLTLTGGLAQGNGAAEGGAIYSAGTLSLSNVTVKTNQALGNNGTTPTKKQAPGGTGASASGGGLYVAGGTVTLSDTTFTGNSAQGGNGGNGAPAQGLSAGGAGGSGGAAGGGGMYVAGGTVTLSQDTFSSNTAKGGTGGDGSISSGGGGGAASGGGMAVADGVVTSNNDTLSSNQANGGSGGFGFRGADSGGAASGGAIDVAQGTVTLSHDTLGSNQAKGGNSNAGSGGGLYVAAGTVTLNNDTLNGNHANGGGANGTQVAVGGAGSGGGLYVAAGTVTLTHNTFSSNHANGGGGAGRGGGGMGSGGGMTVAGGTVTSSNDTLNSNQANGGIGGNSELDNGGSGGAAAGGGMYVAGGTVTLSNDALRTNQANGGTGGIAAVYTGGGGGPASSGGLYVAGGTVTLSSDTLSSNTATGGTGGNGGLNDGGGGGAASGGAMAVTQGTVTLSIVTLSNDTLSSNQAKGGTGGNSSLGTGGGGGAAAGGSMDVVGGTVTLSSDTLSSNSAIGGNGGKGGGGGAASGGGLDVAAGTTLANTLIAENGVKAGSGSSVGTTAGPDVDGTVAHSDHDLVGNSSGSSGFGAAGSGDILDLTSAQLAGLLDPGSLQDNGGPLAGAPGSEQVVPTIALLPGSSAIDAGDPSAPGLSSADQRGYARSAGIVVDIGAYEYGATPANTDLSISGNAPSSVAPGGQITYTLTVSNNSSSAQSNVTLVDNLPANTTLVSWTAPSGGWSSGAPAPGSSRGTVSGWIPTLAAGTSASFTLVIQSDSNTLGGTVISNTASVGPITDDPNPSNNSVTFQTTATPYVDGKGVLQVQGRHANDKIVLEPNPSNASYTDVVDNGTAVGTFANAAFSSINVQLLTGDSLTLADTGGSSGLAFFTAPVTVAGGGGASTLTLDDSTSSSANVYTVTSTTVSRSDYGLNFFGGVTYANVGQLTLQDGSGTNLVNVLSTSATLDVFGHGQGSVYVGSNGSALGGNLQGINGTVLVAGPGAIALTVDDGGDTTGRTATLSNSPFFSGFLGGITGLAPAPIEWIPTSNSTGGVTGLAVNGGSGGNTFNVTGTSNFSSSMGLSTGTGNDTVNVEATTGAMNISNPGGQDSIYVGSNGSALSGNVQGIHGGVTVGGAGATALTVDAGGDTLVRKVTVTSSAVTGLGNPAPIQYGSGVSALAIIGSKAASTYTVQSTQAGTATTINGGLANDTFQVGDATHPLSGIQGGLTLNGGGGTDKATLTDTAQAQSEVYYVTANQFFGGATAGVDFSGLKGLTFNAGTGSVGLVVIDVSTALPVTFTGGGGSDVLYGPDASNTWAVTGTNAGKLTAASVTGKVLGTVSFSKVPNLFGNSLADLFKVSPGKSLSGFISDIGGGGIETIDYSLWTTGVTVNLGTNAATNIAGGVYAVENINGGKGNDSLTGDANNNIIRGGGGNDTIVGGGGNDILIGGQGAASLSAAGSGRSILIGGKSTVAQTLTGSAQDDIFIGGYTNYDKFSLANDEALMAILAEWTSGDSEATRKSKITSGVGTGAKDKFKLLTTVFSDGASDNINGNGAESGDTDWIINT
jgi:uncharacterized repeat protein (TIGR01451 family)